MREGWEIWTLGEVCEELFAGGDVPKDNSSKFKTENYQIPIFSNGEKNKGLYGFTDSARVTKPSITIAARGTIGYSEIRYEPFYPAIRLIVAIPNPDILDLSFLKYIISGIDFTHSGSSIPQLTVPITKSKRESGDTPYYGASGIVDYVADYLFDEDLLCISEDGANLLARTYPIAFSISGKTWVNNHAHVLKFSELTTQKFVETYINSIRIDEYVSGMAQPKLNQKMLNKIPIPLPTFEEQKAIVEKIDALQAETKKLEAIYQQKLADLEELKKSVLEMAFNGELTGREIEV